MSSPDRSLPLHLRKGSIPRSRFVSWLNFFPFSLLPLSASFHLCSIPWVFQSNFSWAHRTWSWYLCMWLWLDQEVGILAWLELSRRRLSWLWTVQAHQKAFMISSHETAYVGLKYSSRRVWKICLHRQAAQWESRWIDSSASTCSTPTAFIRDIIMMIQ